MPNIIFKLKEPNSDKETLILLQTNINKEKFIYSTGLKLKPSQWNKEKQRVKEHRSFPSYSDFNNELNNLEHSALSIIMQYRNNKKLLTKDLLKKELTGTTEPVAPDPKKITLLDYFDVFLKSKDGKISTGAIGKYKRLKTVLLDYQIYSKTSIDFDTIDLTFYDNFTNYLDKRNYSESYKGNFIKDLKVVLNHATERSINTNLVYKSKDFKRTNFVSDNVYLTDNEVQKIFDFDLSQNEKLSKVRDFFLLCCYTGLRYSDASTLTKDNLKIKIDATEQKYNVIVKTTKKTSKEKSVTVEIPISGNLQKIFDRYNGQPPPKISEQKTNKYLEELFIKMSFDENVVITKMIGGQKQDIVYKKYELIRTHTGRRTFCTNTFKAGIPVAAIIRMTGHATESEFLKYIKITNEENASILAKHDFFK